MANRVYYNPKLGNAREPEAGCNCAYGLVYLDNTGCHCDDGETLQPSDIVDKRFNAWFNPYRQIATDGVPQAPVAPKGYQYIWNGTAWVMTVDYTNSNTRITPVPVPPSVQPAAVDITSTFQTFYSANKGLVLLAAAGLLYFVTKK